MAARIRRNGRTFTPTGEAWLFAGLLLALSVLAFLISSLGAL